MFAKSLSLWENRLLLQLFKCNEKQKYLRETVKKCEEVTENDRKN